MKPQTQIYIRLCLILMGASTLFAQKATLTLSSQTKLDKKEYFIKFLHSDQTGHYMLLGQKAKGTILNITKYDKNWNVVSKQPYMVNEKNISYENIFHLKGGLLLCTSKNDKKNREILYHTTYISLDGQAAKPQLIASVKYNFSAQKPYTFWRLSSDSSKVLFATRSDENSIDKPLVSITVIDNRGQKLWAKKALMAYAEKQMSFDDWSVSNDGIVYMLATIPQKRKYQ